LYREFQIDIRARPSLSGTAFLKSLIDLSSADNLLVYMEAKVV